MKKSLKLVLALAAIAMVAGLSSCKKTCTCTDSDGETWTVDLNDEHNVMGIKNCRQVEQINEGVMWDEDDYEVDCR
jgi:hypothetical protein